MVHNTLSIELADLTVLTIDAQGSFNVFQFVKCGIDCLLSFVGIGVQCFECDRGAQSRHAAVNLVETGGRLCQKSMGRHRRQGQKSGPVLKKLSPVQSRMVRVCCSSMVNWDLHGVESTHLLSEYQGLHACGGEGYDFQAWF